MNSRIVKNIYNTLYKTESKFKKKKEYPIHKRLSYKKFGYKDVYDWVNSTINIQKNIKILDAGCGVGFGSLLLAKNKNLTVKGISLSDSEIEQARLNAVQFGLTENCSFKVQSFDQVPSAEQYDIIIAVESLKHSFNLPVTLNNLMKNLKPNGQLIIIEDFYIHQENDKIASKYISDWHLINAFSLSDYFAVLQRNKCKLYDLTNFVLKQNSLKIKFRILLTNTLIFLSRSKEKISSLTIFRGGFYLDRLYTNNKMTYQVLIFIK